MRANDYTNDESMRNSYPYVMTNQGLRRKIGSRARYGMNPRTGDALTPTRLGAMPSRLGTAMPQIESRFSASQREATDQTAANAAYLASKNGPVKKKPSADAAAGKKGLANMLASARNSTLGK